MRATCYSQCMPVDSILSPETTPLEESVDLSLRPSSLGDYVGQERIKESIRIAVTAARNRKQSIDHLLFYGPPGLGKTSLAHIIAHEMGSTVRVTAGPAITRAGDLAAILTNLQPGDILFIDEIHRLNRTVEETLYPAMEDFALDIILGKGPGARSVRIDLPPFTLVGATTRAGALSHPLRDRFGIVHRLEYYSDDEIASILLRSSRILSIDVAHEALMHVAGRARRTPRVANRLLRRVRDFAAVQGSTSISLDLATQALDQLEIDSLGLDSTDRLVLSTIGMQFNGGPVGLETLAAATGEEPETLEDVIEPYLLRIGFLDRTSRGRVITPLARSHMGLPLP